MERQSHFPAASCVPPRQGADLPCPRHGFSSCPRTVVPTADAIQLTRSPVVDYLSLLSPDGRAIVFLRKEGPDLAPVESLFRLDLDANDIPMGEPQTLFNGCSITAGLDWTSNGEDLIVCQSSGGYYGPLNSRLFRMPGQTG